MTCCSLVSFINKSAGDGLCALTGKQPNSTHTFCGQLNQVFGDALLFEVRAKGGLEGGGGFRSLNSHVCLKEKSDDKKTPNQDSLSSIFHLVEDRESGVC